MSVFIYEKIGMTKKELKMNFEKLKKKMLNVISLCLLVTLTACGFEPLYKQNQANLGQVAISSEIFIDVIADREGQILRELLRRKISRAHEGSRYTLDVDLKIKTTDLGINIDDVATRKVLWVSAKYRLLEKDKIVSTGKSMNNVSYAINDNEFITMNARKDEIEKSLELIADDIKLKVSSFEGLMK